MAVATDQNHVNVNYYWTPPKTVVCNEHTRAKSRAVKLIANENSYLHKEKYFLASGFLIF